MKGQTCQSIFSHCGDSMIEWVLVLIMTWAYGYTNCGILSDMLLYLCRTLHRTTGCAVTWPG
jgi:hypothetical protein